MRTLLLEEMSWPEIKEAMANGFDTVIVYAASIEQHGPHLPENTDTVLGYTGAVDLAERLGKALVAPVIRPGLSKHHMSLPGTITLRPEVFTGIVEDYISAYVRHGFKNIVLSSAHGGNFNTLDAIAERENQKYPDTNIISGHSLQDLLSALEKLEQGEGLADGTCGGHSDAWETSEMLLVAPQNVHIDKAECGFMGKLAGETERRFFEEGVISLSPNGIIGDARCSDAQRGKRFFSALQDMQERVVRKKLGTK